MKSALAAGLIALAGCGNEFTASPLVTGDAGADAVETGGAGDSAGHEAGTDAAGGHDAGTDAGGQDAGGAGGQPCEDQYSNISGGGEYVDKGQNNVQMICLTVLADCDDVLKEITVNEEYISSPTNGILSNGTLWINDQVVKGGVFPVTVSPGTNKIVFSNVNGAIQNGALTKVCAGGDIKADAGGNNVRMVVKVGALKTNHSNNPTEMVGGYYTVNP